MKGGKLMAKKDDVQATVVVEDSIRDVYFVSRFREHR